MFSIKFAKFYSKLKNEEFTTFRTKQYRIGENYNVVVGDRVVCVATLRSQICKQVANIETKDLIEDTDTKTRREAILELRKYYPKISEESLVYVLRFKRVSTLFDHGDLKEPVAKPITGDQLERCKIGAV